MGLAVGVAVAVGATAFAAADVAVAGFTIGATLETVAAVGAVTSVIGTVTGNKSLQLAGGALGIVGGVGALAGSAGLFDSGQSIFGSASDAGAVGNATGGIGPVVDSAPNVTTEDLPAPTAGSADSAVTSTGAVNQNAINPVGVINSTSAQTEGDASAIESGGDNASPLANALSPGAAVAPPSPVTSTDLPGSTASSTSVAGNSAAGSPGSASGSQTMTFGGNSNPFNGITTPGTTGVTMPDGSPLGVGTGTGASTDGSLISNVMSWAKGNPMAAYGIVQAGGSLIAGLTNPVTPAQISALDAQANANNAAAALAQNQAKNLSQPLPTATVSTPQVTGKPLLNNPAMPTTNPTAPGLINSQPVSAPVTGAPAPLTVGA